MYKTYVMHYKPLAKRYEFVNNELTKMDITDAEFITEFDKEELSDDIVSRHYDKSPELRSEQAQISMREGEAYEYETLSISSISLNMKHISAFRKFIEQEQEFAVFLEDDCEFLDTLHTIEGVIKNAPKNWDVIFLGGAFDHGIVKPLARIDGYILADHPASNTTSSILYKKESVKKMMPHLEPFSLPIDWQINHAMYKAELNVYHIYPYLCTQGRFRSTAKDE